MLMQLLTTFAVLSMAGTVLLSLLPENGMKRTAGLAVGLLTILCWAEGIAHLLEISLDADFPASVFSASNVTQSGTAFDDLTALEGVAP